jgi:hypothetical protein
MVFNVVTVMIRQYVGMHHKKVKRRTDDTIEERLPSIL